MSTDPTQTAAPQVPCPNGDDGTLTLSYYLAHQADICLHRGDVGNALLFQAAADWVKGKGGA